MFWLLMALSCRTNDKPKLQDDTISDTTVDLDGDGYNEEEDCDDLSAAINPDAVEICDGIDNNCDDSVDEGVTTDFYMDADGDGECEGG